MLTDLQYDCYNALIDCGFSSDTATLAVMCPNIGRIMIERRLPCVDSTARSHLSAVSVALSAIIN